MTAVLPTRFPVPTTAIDGVRECLPLRRVEPEVGAYVRHTSKQHAACELEPLDGSQHGLIGEVDDDFRRERRERLLDVGGEWDAVVLAAAKLLLSADEDGDDEVVGQLRERVAYDGCVVLAVDDRDGSHERAVTSSSIEPVNFAYSRVSRENETSCTWP